MVEHALSDPCLNVVFCCDLSVCPLGSAHIPHPAFSDAFVASALGWHTNSSIKAGVAAVPAPGLGQGLQATPKAAEVLKELCALL